MRAFAVSPISRLKGEIALPGDKSIAHRSIIISAISRGKTLIKNFPANKDCLYTLDALRRTGVKITFKKYRNAKINSISVRVQGKGLKGLRKPARPVFLGDSGTSLRLLSGVFAGQDFECRLIAGRSLSQRPMLRVNHPLRMMGAKINSKLKIKNSKIEEYPPITIRGGSLRAIDYTMPVASAQVKSAILLAALYARGRTRVIENIPTRDHTERMLKLFKAGIRSRKKEIVLTGNRELTTPGLIVVPGDISSAAFFLVLASIVPGSRLVIKDVSLNPKRAGIIKALKRMGADIKVSSVKCKVSSCEPSGDIVVKSSRLKGITVKAREIPFLIDELPILMVAACYARGKTTLQGVGELRVKETDRINSMAANLRKMGASLKVSQHVGGENIIIQSKSPLRGARVRSYQDHRTAMSMIVAGLAARGATSIDDIGCINKSFPGFTGVLKSLKASSA